MARVFISHSSRDNAVAREMLGWLQQQGFEHAFLDFDEALGIPAGSRWESTLYEELQRCQAVLLLLTPHWFDSKWCFAEFVQARAAGKAIVPLVMVPIEGRSVAADLQHLDLVADREGSLRRLAAELSRVALFTQGGFDWDRSRPPYPGLAAFEAEDAAIYFGRDPEVRALIERLEARRVQGGLRVVALLGASGSGKSSLVRAGVLPRLARDRAHWQVLPPLRPRADPLRELARAAVLGRSNDSNGGDSGDSGDWLALQGRLRSGDPRAVADAVTAMVDEALLASPQACLLVTIDQAEELFTSTPPDARSAFARVLCALAESPAQVLVLLTMRSDMFGHWQALEPALPKAEVFPLPPMPPDRLVDVVEGPARIGGFSVAPGLAAAIGADASGRDALPLVAFTLRELYIATVGDRGARGEAAGATIRVEDYQRLGDPASGLTPVQVAVRRRADEVLATLALDAAGLKALRDVFVERLTNLDADGQFTRRPARWRDLAPAATTALDAFIDARLLSSRQEGDERIVEVSHEALLRTWPTLVRWLNEETDFLAGRRQLEHALAEWQRAPEPQRAGALLQGLLLERAADWLAKRPTALSDEQRGFVAQSKAQRAAQVARQKQQRWALAALGVVVLGLGGVLMQAWRSGQELERDLSAQRLLRLSTASAEARRVELALEQAAQAHRVHPDYRTHSALLQTGMALSPHFEAAAMLREGGAAPAALAWAGDGTGLLVGDAEGDLLGSAARSDPALRTLHAAGAVDKNRGRRALGVRADAQGGWSMLRADGLWLHAAAGAAAQTRWQGPPLAFAALSPAADAAVVLTEERAVLLVTCGTAPAGCQAQPIDLPAAALAAAGWDAGGKQAAISLADGRLALITRGTGVPPTVRALGSPQAQAPRVLSVAAEPGSRRWWVSDVAGRLLMFDAGEADGTPAALRTTPGSGTLTRLSWSPDGQRLAAACMSLRLCLWDRQDGELVRLRAVLAAHQAPLAGVAWSPNGERLASVDITGRRVLWRADTGASPARTLDDAAGPPLSDVAFDRKGARLAAASSDGSWFVWSLDPLRLTHRGTDATPGGTFESRTLQWHPQQPWLAIGRPGGATWVTLDGGGAKTRAFEWPAARGETLAWAADGSALFVALTDGSIGRLSTDPRSGVAGAALAPWGQPHTEAVLGLAAAAAPAASAAPLLFSADALGVVRLQDGGATAAPVVEMQRIAGRPLGLDALSLSADGKRWLAAGNHGDVFVFDRSNHKLLARLETGAEQVVNAAFSPDGATVAAIDNQQRLHLWQGEPPFAPRASVLLRTPPGYLSTDNTFTLGGLRRLAWLPNGRLAIAAQNGQLLLLSTRPDDWVQRAAGWAAPAAGKAASQ